MGGLGEGKVEEQFQDAVAQALEVLEDVDSEKYEIPKDHVVAAKIEIEAVLELDVETGTLAVGGRVVRVRVPKRRLVARAGARSGGTVMVEKARQADLLQLAREKEDKVQ